MYRILIFLLSFTFFTACQSDTSSENKSSEQKEATSTPAKKETKYKTTGSIERMDPKLDELIAPNAQLEIIAEGFDWTEGPLWVETHKMLLFSDIPPNSIYKWTEKEGKSLFLKPSGFTGESGRGGEPGSNGLLLDADGRLVLCQHGDRRVARMDVPIVIPSPTFTTLADRYDGKRFNSPNDATYSSKGELFVTDPPYGLEKQTEDPAKEIPFQGVYRVDTSGQVSLLTDELTRPNGIALSPDEKTLYVANSDPERAIWMQYDLGEDGSISNGKVFFDATSEVPNEKGLPDGMKIDDAGNIYATGPGGVWIFSPEGKQLGLIRTGQATSNCAFNADKSVLYMTADMYVMRLQLK